MKLLRHTIRRWAIDKAHHDARRGLKSPKCPANIMTLPKFQSHNGRPSMAHHNATAPWLKTTAIGFNLRLTEVMEGHPWQLLGSEDPPKVREIPISSWCGGGSVHLNPWCPVAMEDSGMEPPQIWGTPLFEKALISLDFKPTLGFLPVAKKFKITPSGNDMDP